LTNLPMSVIM